MLLLTLASVWIWSLSEAKVYYVSSPDGVSCPNNTFCNNLSFYTGEPTVYFTNDTIFNFLEGTHNLEHSLVISGVSNVMLVGRGTLEQGFHETFIQSTVVVTCLKGNNIIFNMQSNNILVSFITFMNCSNLSKFGSQNDNIQVTLLFHEVFNITLNHVSIQNYNGYGLAIWNGYNVMISSSSFANSNVNTYLLFTTPMECFSMIKSFTVDIISSNFSFAQGERGDGLVIKMRQQYSYYIDTSIDIVTAFNNSRVNIAYVMTDGIPRSIQLINTSSMYGEYGLIFIVTSSENTQNNSCPHVGVSKNYLHSEIKVLESKLVDNVKGILLLFLSFLIGQQELSVQAQFCSCKIIGNYDYGLLLDKDLDENNLVTLLLQHTEVQGNGLGLFSAVFVYRSTVYFTNVRITDNFDTGLFALDSTVYFSGSNSFVNNTGEEGGAIVLYHSDMIIYRNTSISFIDNHAQGKGGAIHIDRVCALQISNIATTKHENNISLTFFNNSASIAGDIYGLNSNLLCTINIGNLAILVNVVTTPGKRLSFSTDPIGVCVCGLESSLRSCFNQTFNNDMSVSINISTYPGDIISIPIAVVGFGGDDTYALTDGDIIVSEKGKNPIVTSYDGTTCFTLHHKVMQPNVETQSIYVHISTKPTFLDSVIISTQPAIDLKVSFSSCPNGFQLTNLPNGVCDCNDVLKGSQFNVICNITTREIDVNRNGPLWLGTLNNTDNTCLINTTCSFDYCRDGSVSFHLNDANKQCALDRAGILCSKCSEGLSLMLGSNKCGRCSSSYISLIIPFCLAGIALVALLISLNLTVSVGTINGLIFYTNIIKLYEHVFFPNGSIPFLSQFISWLNLDLGIETCFYHGLNTYAKAWLQFVFPFYIWFIICFIILLCRWFSKASKLMGSHVVPVLATLFLLSYTKLMRTIVFVIKIKRIAIYCENTIQHELRWFADPSVRYFSKDLLILIVFTLAILVFFVIPYTIILLFSPLLQGYLSKYKCCTFWNKLKPVFDAYNGPYKDKFRFWTGLLLVARLPIIIVVSLPDVSENGLIAVIITIAILFAMAYSFGGVYRIWYLNVLESSFLLNLAILTVAATKDTSKKEYTVVLILSICVAFMAFIGILIFHIYLRFSKGGYIMTDSKMQALASKTLRHKSTSELSETDRLTNDSNEVDTKRDSTSYMELRRRESLLLDDDDDSSNYMLITNN